MAELTYRLKTVHGLTDQLTSGQLAAFVSTGQVDLNTQCTPDDGDTWLSIETCLPNFQVITQPENSTQASVLSAKTELHDTTEAHGEAGASSETGHRASNDTLDTVPKRKLRKLNTVRNRQQEDAAKSVPLSSGSLSGLVGKSLANGRYVVQSEFGSGSMAYVFRASDNRLQTDVIVKIPKPEKITLEDYRERFHRESQLLVRLSHPHVVKVLDVGEVQQLPYVVMQLLAGGTLLDRINQHTAEQRKMAPESLSDWIREVARALDFCFKRGMVHRDVKPANILFDDDNNAYVSDFGLTKIMHGEHTELCSSGTADGIVLGTPNYLPPEIILGGRYDGRADQYSLGLTVYHALCGQPPMQGKSATATMVNQTRRNLQLLSDVRADIPRSLALAIDKSIQKDPQKRFESCVEFSEAVLDGLRTESASASSRSLITPQIENSTSASSGMQNKSSSHSRRSVRRSVESSASSKQSQAVRKTQRRTTSRKSRPARAQYANDDWLQPAMPPRKRSTSRRKSRQKKASQSKNLIVFGKEVSLPIVATAIVAAILFPVVIAYQLWTGGDGFQLTVKQVPDIVPAAPAAPNHKRTQEPAKLERTADASGNKATQATQIGLSRNLDAEDSVSDGADSSAASEAATSTERRETAPDADVRKDKIRIRFDSGQPITISDSVSVAGVNVYDNVHEQPVRQLQGQYSAHAIKGISPNGRLFVATTESLGQASAGATIWDTQTGEVVASIPADPEKQIDVVMVGNERVYFAEHASDVIRELRSNQFANVKLKSFRLAGARFRKGRTALSPDGKFIAAPTANGLSVFRATDGTMVGTMTLPKSIARSNARIRSLLASLQSLRFSLQGDQLAAVAAAPYPTLYIWDGAGQLTVQHRLNSEYLSFDWLNRPSVICMGAVLADRETNQILLQAEGGLHRCGDDSVVVFGEKQTVVQQVPWAKIATAVDAMQNDDSAVWYPQNGVSLTISLGQLTSRDPAFADEVRRTIKSQLVRNGLQVMEKSHHKIVVRVIKTKDAAEHQLTIECHNRTTANASIEPVWSKIVADVSELYSEQSSQRTSARKAVIRQLNSTAIPYYVPSNSDVASLPIVLQ